MRKIGLSAVWTCFLFLTLYPAAAQDRFRDCDACPEMIVVPAGAFDLGSPEEEADRIAHEGPQSRTVFDKPFALGMAEVTRGEYAAFVADTGYEGGDTCTVYDGLYWQERFEFDWRRPGFAQTDDHPVVCVSWEDAEFYLLWLRRKTGKSYRLPTEAEWEYAARAGTTTRFPHGDDPDYANVCDHGNGAAREANIEYHNPNCEDAYAHTAPSDAFPPNPWGFRNMIGNVLEWTSSCYSIGHGRGGVEDCRYRVLRNGNWAGARDHLRSAARGLNPPTARWSTNGFRVALDLE